MTMKPSMIAAVVLVVAMAQAREARADARSEVEEQLHSDMRRLNSSLVDELQEYGKCRAMLAIAKKKLKPGDKLKSPNFERHPKGVKAGDDWTITVADIPWICDAIDLLVQRGTLFTALESAQKFEKILVGKPALDGNPNVRIGAGAYHLELAKTCAASVAKEIGSGATAIVWKGTSIAVADAEKLCGVLVKWGEYMNASGEANFEKVAPKYRALGIDGDRLRLFVEYDDVSFRGKKCVIIDGLEQLAKAKVVYQWLENSDGTHTIRKYQFKGNTWKKSEKTYKTEAAAYKGCP